jgi:hypothetical protein
MKWKKKRQTLQQEVLAGRQGAEAAIAAQEVWIDARVGGKSVGVKLRTQ